MAWRRVCRGARTGAEERLRRDGRVLEWGRWMLADVGGVGQVDGRTERGGHVRATGCSDKYGRMAWVLAKSHMLCYFWRKHNLPCSTNPTPLEHFSKSKTFVEPEGNKAVLILPRHTEASKGGYRLQREIFTPFPSLSSEVSLKFFAGLKGHEIPL